MLIKQGESRADFISRQVRSLLDDNRAESEDEAIALAAQDYDSQRVKISAFKVSDVDTEERTVTAIISSDAIDRDDEVLLPKGAELEHFRKNPVVLWSHNSSIPPIGKALWIEKKRNKIIAKVKFATTELAEEVWQLFKGGFLKAFSVGFMPIIPGRAPLPAELKRNPDLADARRIFPEWEMLEFSPVSIPSNRDALVMAIKSGGFEHVAKDFDIEVDFGTEKEIKDIGGEELSSFEIQEKKFDITPIIKCEEFIEVTVGQIAVEGFDEAMKKHKGIVYA